jgi:hypothetical protein
MLCDSEQTRKHQTGFCTEWFKSVVQYLMRLLGRLFGAENATGAFFQIHHSFRETTFYAGVALCYRGCLTTARGWQWEYRQLKRSYQIWTVVPLSSLKSLHPHEQKYLNSGDWKNATVGGICFTSFFYCKRWNHLTRHVKTNCFHFVKIDNHNNRSYINVKSS